MLWDQYVFRKGTAAVQDMWDQFFARRKMRLAYVAGGGFDVRTQVGVSELVSSIEGTRPSVESAKLILVDLEEYEISEELAAITDENVKEIERIFSCVGDVKHVAMGKDSKDDDETSASVTLRTAVHEVHQHIQDVTDIVIDVSSLPRVVYLALITSLLEKYVGDSVTNAGDMPLAASGVNIQLVVAEDAGLDAEIVAEDPSKELVVIPGFSGALHVESIQEWPVVWFPLLGENRVAHMQILMDSATIPTSAEVCPVIPHPSMDLRRGDRLVAEYREQLFDRLSAPTGNIMYAHESQPFEAYRQLLGAMKRYKKSMELLGGCRLVVTPLGSKLITIGAGLACYEMKATIGTGSCAVAISHVKPQRYVAPTTSLRTSRPELSAAVLTGSAYIVD